MLEPARDYFAAGQAEKTLEICDAALQKYTGLAQAHLLRAHALVGLGRLDDADAAYAAAISHDNTKAEPFWARAQLAQGNLEKFVDRLDDILKQFPRDLTAIFNKGMALMQLNRVSESLPLWEELIEEDSNNAAAWGNKGAITFSTLLSEGASLR